MAHTLRPATEADEPLLRALFEEARAGEFAHLPAELRAQLVAMQWRARAADWRARFPSAEDAIIEVDGHAVGRLLVQRDPAGTRLIDVALLPHARGAGLGAALVGGLCAEGRPVSLTVHVDNPARRLYARTGFVLESEAPPYLHLRFVPGGRHAST
jgi:GNAT superfamily N-acetyltransferase